MEPEARWEQGRARFPTVILDRGDFLDHVASLDDAGEDPDLYLACACLKNAPGALDELERYVWSQIPLYLTTLRPSADAVEEIRQQLRERILVSRVDGAPRLAAYNGQGPLGAWVRVAALRLAIDQLDTPGRERSLAEMPALATPVDPELAYVRERYRDHYQNALRDALERLTSKDRSLLRLSVVDGLGIDALARIHQVHRATAARWLISAREQLLQETYGLLGERLRIAPSELKSLAALVRSELHVSLARLL